MFGFLKRLFRRKDRTTTPEEAIERAKAETQQKLTQWNAQLSQYHQLLARLEKSVAAGEAEEQKLTARIRDLLQQGQRGEARETALRLEPIRQRLAGERQQWGEARNTYEKLKQRRDAAARRVREQIDIVDRQRERAELMEAESRIVQSLADETFEIEATRGLAAAQAALEQRADRAEAELWLHRDVDTTLEEEEEKERREHADELLAEFETAPRLAEPVEAGRTVEIEALRSKG
jgi:hypothetical protein